MPDFIFSLLLSALKIGIPLCCFILIAVWFFQDKLIFFPHPPNPSAEKHFSDARYSIEINGQKLTGWLIRNKATRKSPFIIYYGGNAEDISDNLWEISNFPDSSFLFMNYRGYGNSTGKPSETAFIEDAVSVIDHVTGTLAIPPESILLIGRSLGSGVAVQVASKRSVKGVILITPFDSILNIARSQYPFLPVKYLLKHPFDSESVAHNINIPVLMLAAGDDEIIPFLNTNKLYTAWNGPKKLITIDSATHNSINESEAYWRAVHDFISRIFHG